MKPFVAFYKLIFVAFILIVSLQSNTTLHQNKYSTISDDEYVCTPCGQDCDATIFHEPGKCPTCNMPLVKKTVATDIKNIEPSDICKYLSTHPGIVLLDVRTKEEFDGKVSPDFGTLQNAMNIPVKDLASRLQEIASLKNKEILVYCSHSHRSPQAAYILQQNGFTNVVNMSGGMSVVKDDQCKKVRPLPNALPAGISLTAAVERQLNSIESSIVSLADAMPEDKFNFSPDDLSIKGSAYKGVRTYAGQIKHLATDNYAIWSAITGDPLPPGIKDVNGPEEIKSKADIMKYLKESFAVGHKAIATLTADNAMDQLQFRGSTLPRLDLAFYALTHDNDHYGQMIVYLRMCGILPPGAMPVQSR